MIHILRVTRLLRSRSLEAIQVLVWWESGWMGRLELKELSNKNQSDPTQALSKIRVWNPKTKSLKLFLK